MSPQAASVQVHSKSVGIYQCEHSNIVFVLRVNDFWESSSGIASTTAIWFGQHRLPYLAYATIRYKTPITVTCLSSPNRFQFIFHAYAVLDSRPVMPILQEFAIIYLHTQPINSQFVSSTTTQQWQVRQCHPNWTTQTWTRIAHLIFPSKTLLVYSHGNYTSLNIANKLFK